MLLLGINNIHREVEEFETHIPLWKLYIQDLE